MVKPLIDKEIDGFYSLTSENDRMKFGLGPLEFERNKELIQRFLPSKGGVIADIGGGPGIYSEWLARMGFAVYLVDPVEKHIVQAKARAAKVKNGFKCIRGESQSIQLPDSIVDMVISHGPLYHLQDRVQREKALHESFRILKPGGIFLGWAINYTASTIVGLLQGVLQNDDVFNMCLSELTTGGHNAPESMPGILPKAFYHKPQELFDEVKGAGLVPLDMYAVEGIIWIEKNYFDVMGKASKKEKLMQLLKISETDRNLLAISPHVMIAARKPAG
ncbi:MAG: class I SAM-dependent methyltransferase [Bacteroidales bacterium]|nr:class I SAM-dependent methyltransferase [Bacteroidales bacterium]